MDPSAGLTLDHLWVVVCAALVFLMQAGFKCFEVGMVRPQHSTGVGMKNVVDWCVGSVIFFLIGFGLMFGPSLGGLVGTGLFGLENLDAPGGSSLGIVFFMFQLAFAGTAITIVSGAMSERTGFIPYLVLAAIGSLVIYPVFGHWTWGNAFYPDNKPWLVSLGFVDFAGSTVVHSVGAWIALVGIVMIGPRLGRFAADGSVRPFKSTNPAYAMLGVFILWFGWWGFNGGSTLAFNGSIGKIILNTNLAGAIGGLVAYFHCYAFQGKRDAVEKFLGGILGGLVAVTAGCSVMTPWGALATGALAGVVHNLAYDLMLRKKLDDPVGAIPVHGACGVLGTLCVALFGQADLLPNPRLVQFGVQALGVAACMAWTVTVSVLAFRLLKMTVGLRVSPAEEREGIALGVVPVKEPEPQMAMNREELLKLLAS